MLRTSRRWLLILPLALLVAAGVFLLAGGARWLRAPLFSYEYSWPGRDAFPDARRRLVVRGISQGAEQLLDTGPAWQTSYLLAGRTGVPPAEPSDTVATADQITRLRYLTEDGERRAFQDLHRWILEHRTNETGRLLTEAGDPVPNAVTLSWLRALAEADMAWSDRDAGDALRTGSDALLQEVSGALLPPDGQVDTGDVQTDVVRLDGLDVVTLRLLRAVDGRWAAVAEEAERLLDSARLDGPVPLSSWGVSPETGAPALSRDGDPEVDTGSALLVCLHRCEAGMDVTAEVSWIRARLLNDRKLAPAYNAVTGEAQDSAIEPWLYGTVARIARVLDDEDLFTLAEERLTYHIADLRSSAAYGAVFRTESAAVPGAEDRYRVTATDNLWALRGLQ